MINQQDAQVVVNVWKLARSVRIAMLVLHDGESMSARPMESLIPEGEEAVWFITNRNSLKVSEAIEDFDALLTYSTGEKGEHLAMNGILSVVDDREQLKALWNRGADLYFPKGPDDPSAILLRFEPTRGEFWTHDSGVVRLPFQYAKAKLTGIPAKLGDHGQVAM